MDETELCRSLGRVYQVSGIDVHCNSDVLSNSHRGFLRQFHVWIMVIVFLSLFYIQIIPRFHSEHNQILPMPTKENTWSFCKHTRQFEQSLYCCNFLKQYFKLYHLPFVFPRRIFLNAVPKK